MNGEWIRNARSDTSVVFVHGILAKENSSWRHVNGTYWPGLLAQEQELEGVNVYVFSYRTGIFSGTYQLGDVVDALKERMRLDGLLDSKRLIFVCHSMGGIVARRFIVVHQMDFRERQTQLGLFLVASPSLGSSYANLLTGLGRALGIRNAQAGALRFAQDNAWLNDLDKDFINLKETGALAITAKELVEDTFIVIKGWWRRQVVEPFSGARYFGESYKVEGSDHSSIATPKTPKAIQHQLLYGFIREMLAEPISVIQKGKSYDAGHPIGEAGWVDTEPGFLHHLRSPVNDFVNREEEVDRLVQALSKAAEAKAPVCLICGMGGIGKTELAYAVVQKLNQVRLFPHAQIRLNLHGSDVEPITSEQALRTIISYFPNTHPSDDLSSLQALYYSVLYEKRALILADDAKGAAQVEPLLPPAGCALLITSRQRFTLPGMTQLEDLETLPEAEAKLLLQSICPRIEDEASALAKLCGYLPLALRVSASILATDWTWDVRAYRESLENEQKRLQLLQAPSDSTLNVNASLAKSFEVLRRDDPQALTALCLLSVFPTSFDREAALAVVELSIEEGVATVPARTPLENLLAQLNRYSLLEYDTTLKRYQQHDLVRTFVRDLLEREDQDLYQQFADRLELVKKQDEPVHRRHATYYLSLAEEAAQGLRGAQQDMAAAAKHGARKLASGTSLAIRPRGSGTRTTAGGGVIAVLGYVW